MDGFESDPTPNESSNTKTKGVHKICMFSICAIGSDGRLLYERNIETAASDNDIATKQCTKKFISLLLELEPWFKDLLGTDLSLPPSAKDIDKLFEDKSCVICEKDFDWSRDIWPSCYKQEIIKRGLRSERLLVTDVPDPDDDKYSIIQHHHLHSIVAPPTGRYLGAGKTSVNLKT